MTDPALESAISAARAYETLFVPALFGPWAPRVVDAASIAPGHVVLDVACGTGVLAREALRRAGPTGRVTGLDPNHGMLAVAAELAPSIDWQPGQAEAMPFGDASFDAVVSQFGLMFMDRQRAVREMLRVSKADGRLAVAVWDAVDSMPAYATEVAVLERVAGHAAADALRAPFVLGDPELLRGLFETVGAASVAISTQPGVARFPNIQVMVEADLRGWLPILGVHLSEETIARVLDAAHEALDAYVGEDGSVTFETSAHLVTATRP